MHPLLVTGRMYAIVIRGSQVHLAIDKWASCRHLLCSRFITAALVTVFIEAITPGWEDVCETTDFRCLINNQIGVVTTGKYVGFWITNGSVKSGFARTTVLLVLYMSSRDEMLRIGTTGNFIGEDMKRYDYMCCTLLSCLSSDFGRRWGPFFDQKKNIVLPIWHSISLRNKKY